MGKLIDISTYEKRLAIETDLIQSKIEKIESNQITDEDVLEEHINELRCLIGYADWEMEDF